MGGDNNLSYILYFCIVPPVIISCFCLCCLKVYCDYKYDTLRHNNQTSHVEVINIVPKTQIPKSSTTMYECSIDNDTINGNISLGKNDNGSFVVVISQSS